MAGGQYNLQSALQTLDPVGAMGRGQSMAANALSIQDAGQKMQRQQNLSGIRQQAVGMEGGYTPDAHKKLLMDAGYFEEAQDIDDLMTNQTKSKQDITEKAINIVEKTGRLVQQVGAPAWPIFRGSLIEAGVADESTLPTEYNAQAQQMAQSITGNAQEMFRLIKFRSGNQQQDILNVGGKITKGDPYTPGTETALVKNARFLVDSLGMSEEEAAQKLLWAKDKSDSAVYQDLYKTALRSTYGDEEEATRIAKQGLDQIRSYRNTQGKPAANRSNMGAKPSGKFEEGKVYTDANGNKAKYVNGNWEPVQ